MVKRVIVESYNRDWKKDFEDIRSELMAVLEGKVISVEHVGSTSVEGLSAKPVIDIDVVIEDEDAFPEVKAAMEGMLAPEVKEEVTATLEVLQTFHISKVGTIAGCIVREGKIKRGNKVRVIRDGIVIKTAELASLKHVKDDIKEAGVNTECGLSLKAYDDLKEGDILEAFEEIEVAKTL